MLIILLIFNILNRTLCVLSGVCNFEQDIANRYTISIDIDQTYNPIHILVPLYPYRTITDIINTYVSSTHNNDTFAIINYYIEFTFINPDGDTYQCCTKLSLTNSSIVQYNNEICNVVGSRVDYYKFEDDLEYINYVLKAIFPNRTIEGISLFRRFTNPSNKQLLIEYCITYITTLADNNKFKCNTCIIQYGYTKYAIMYKSDSCFLI